MQNDKYNEIKNNEINVIKRFEWMKDLLAEKMIAGEWNSGMN
jgi:hypothetical protein